MISLPNYASIYDFSKIEQAVQSYFISTGLYAAPDMTQPETWAPAASIVPAFTAFESEMFQKHRPRVAFFLNSITPLNKWVADANGALRNNQWRGNLLVEVITAPDYTTHTALRCQVAALFEMIAPMVADPTQLIGANQYLTQHIISYCTAQNADTSIHVEQGFFGSQLNYQLTFGVPEAAILAVA